MSCVCNNEPQLQQQNLAEYLFTVCSATETGTSEGGSPFLCSLQVTYLHEERRTESLKDVKREPNNTGRVQRRSAKVAIYYLHELAGEELAKEWPKRKVLQDLIPDDRKVWSLVEFESFFMSNKCTDIYPLWQMFNGSWKAILK